MSLEFNNEGGKLFAKLTKENVGKSIAIFLDGQPISVPNVKRRNYRRKSPNYRPVHSKRSQAFGAEATPALCLCQSVLFPNKLLGRLWEKNFLAKGIMAGIYGMILVALFLILWYRLPGLAAVLALGLYTIILALFKLIPVTLTAAGIAGFILSVGMAVDANILIFERMKEELKKGKNLQSAISEGFSRAWLSIRDSNISSLITAGILFWMGASMIKGFALTLGVGIRSVCFQPLPSAGHFVGNRAKRRKQD